MNKALFLDRDGVLNRELGRYVASVNEFEVLPTVPEALALASAAGFLLIVVSNQGGVAKGLYGMDELARMEAKLAETVNPLGVSIAETYYCPHHPDRGRCLCRKPSPLLLQKAIARFAIDPAASFMVGDTQRDIDAAAGAGVRGLLMASNDSLLHVVKSIL